MGQVRFRLIMSLVAVAIVAGAAAAFGALSDNFANPPAPVPGNGHVTYLSMKGQKTGTFTGGVTRHGFAGDIAVLALEAGLTSPRDPSSGLPSGRTMCNGISFRKATDRATPLLFSALATNENITTATFTEYGLASGKAAFEAATMRITLTNASISSVHHVDSLTTGAYDDVTLIPQKIQLTWLTGGITSVYSCQSPA